MADKFKPPTMDWSSPGDLHKRFKVFKQKCQLVFDGPMEGEEENKKARMLLLWSGDKGLEIYNAASWDSEGDELKVDQILEKFEQYTKPQSNQILSRYQLRCLKQDDLPLEEFITKARTLIDEAGYNPAFKEEMLRDTLVFGIASDKVRREAISKGNNLTFKQVYDLAKTNESTKNQMQAMTQHSVIHDVKTRRRQQNQAKRVGEPKATTKSYQNNSKGRHLSTQRQQSSRRYKFNIEGCYRCGNKHDPTDWCPAANARCQYCKKEGHFKRVCMKRRLKQVDEIVKSQDYNGEDIHLQDDESCTDRSDSDSDQDYDSSESDDSPITVTISSIASAHTVDEKGDYQEKLFTTVRVNDKRNLKVKVDTGADTCVLTTEDLQSLDLSLTLQPSQNKLKGYGGNTIENIGTVELNVTFKNTSILTKFNVVNAPGHPSMIGCRQAQQLGMVTVNIHELTSSSQPSKVQEAAQSGKLTESLVLEEYADCFNGIGRFPGEKYHITLVDDSSNPPTKKRTGPHPSSV